MIALNWRGMSGEVGAIMSRYDELPRHIAKKHLGAAMKRALKTGVPVLRKNTPKRKKTLRASAVTRDTRGRFTKGSGKIKNIAGNLRRAATVNSKYVGKNRDGFVIGRLGYKYGTESRKAIWLEFGTAQIEPRKIMDRTYAQVKQPASKMLIGEMRKALDRACVELAAGKNPGGAPGFRRKR
jgi:HK97 gp10 family phage protein